MSSLYFSAPLTHENAQVAITYALHSNPDLDLAYKCATALDAARVAEWVSLNIDDYVAHGITVKQFIPFIHVFIGTIYSDTTTTELHRVLNSIRPPRLFV